MTREERNNVRTLGTDTKTGKVDLVLGAAKHVGVEAEYKEAVKNYTGRGSIPDPYAASLGSIVAECEQYAEADAAETKTAAAGKK